jgi:hypothetical protein
MFSHKGTKARREGKALLQAPAPKQRCHPTKLIPQARDPHHPGITRPATSCDTFHAMISARKTFVPLCLSVKHSLGRVQ